jgi:hypothetical protein
MVINGLTSRVILYTIVGWLLEMTQHGDWVFELAYFVVTEVWLSGALPEKQGSLISVRRKANLSENLTQKLGSLRRTRSVRCKDQGKA